MLAARDAEAEPITLCPPSPNIKIHRSPYGTGWGKTKPLDLSDGR